MQLHSPAAVQGMLHLTMHMLVPAAVQGMILKLHIHHAALQEGAAVHVMYASRNLLAVQDLQERAPFPARDASCHIAGNRR